jgi:hypothetical protein
MLLLQFSAARAASSKSKSITYPPVQFCGAGSPNNEVVYLDNQIEKIKAIIRAKVEHPFSHHQEEVCPAEDVLPYFLQEHGAVVHAA